LTDKIADAARFAELTGMVLSKLEPVDLQPLKELDEKIEYQITERARTASLRPDDEVAVAAEVAPPVVETPTSPTPAPAMELEIPASRKTVTGRHKPNLKGFLKSSSRPSSESNE